MDGDNQEKRSLPPIDSVWREQDARLERFVRVDGYEGLMSLPEPKVIIQTVTPTGTGRYTKAALSAFGKRYRLADLPPPPSV